MCNDSKLNEEQKLLNIRMEYQKLFDMGMSFGNMFWVGFGVFFTINTFLATGLGASFSSEAAKHAPNFFAVFRIVVCMLGVLTSVAAIATAWNLSACLGTSRNLHFEATASATSLSSVVQSTELPGGDPARTVHVRMQTWMTRLGDCSPGMATR